MAIKTSREEIYRQIWVRPATQVAQDYGISNVALKKICRRHQIPVPGRGYWARRAVGKRVDPPPGLEAVDPDQPIVIRGRRGVELPDAVRHALWRARVRERRPENRVLVNTAPKDLHRAVAATWDALDKVEPCAIGLVAVSGPDVFPVDVARQSVPRAMAFLNALVMAAEARRYQVTVGGDGLAFLVDGQGVDIKLLEEVVQTPHVPSAEEEWVLRVWEAQQRRAIHTWDTPIEAPRPSIPEFDFELTGRLQAVLADGWPGGNGLRRVFGDGESRKVEKLINAILAGLAAWAAVGRQTGQPPC